MFGNLPKHLSTLNHVASPPAAMINTEREEAFWDFMHTDELFNNFAISPGLGLGSGIVGGEIKLEHAKTVHVNERHDASGSSLLDAAQGGPSYTQPAPTLESFIAAFASDAAVPDANANYRLPVPLPLPFNSTPGMTAPPTPILSGPSIDTASIMGHSPDEDGRISGAKRLKQIGAGVVEIEEDKRRRNTEASARFRAKKKEREQALEQRAKELEAQVAQLAADKASLENENKLLKAIVLGSQGGNPADEAMQSALAQLGAKRKRD